MTHLSRVQAQDEINLIRCARQRLQNEHQSIQTRLIRSAKVQRSKSKNFMWKLGSLMAILVPVFFVSEKVFPGWGEHVWLIFYVFWFLIISPSIDRRFPKKLEERFRLRLAERLKAVEEQEQKLLEQEQDAMARRAQRGPALTLEHCGAVSLADESFEAGSLSLASKDADAVTSHSPSSHDLLSLAREELHHLDTSLPLGQWGTGIVLVACMLSGTVLTFMAFNAPINSLMYILSALSSCILLVLSSELFQKLHHSRRVEWRSKHRHVKQIIDQLGEEDPSQAPGQAT